MTQPPISLQQRLPSARVGRGTTRRAAATQPVANFAHLSVNDVIVRYVNHQVDSGATAVYVACQEGHEDIARHLVDEAGASLKLRCYDGMSCLHAATQSGRQHLLQWLVRLLPSLYLRVSTRRRSESAYIRQANFFTTFNSFIAFSL